MIICLKAEAEKVFRFPIDEKHREFVDQSYDAFLELARRLDARSGREAQQLTDNRTIAQLQDLYYLLHDQALWIEEERTSDGSVYLSLQIRCEP